MLSILSSSLSRNNPCIADCVRTIPNSRRLTTTKILVTDSQVSYFYLNVNNGIPMSTSTRRRFAAEHSKLDILAAAEQRFSEFGYDRTRLEDIATDIGIGRPGLLYHFPNKKQLYRAVLDSVYGDLIERLGRTLAGSGTLVERLLAALEFAIDEVGARPSIARIALRETAAFDPEIIADIRAQARPLMVLLQFIFEEGEKSGELQPVDADPYFLISALSGSVMFYVTVLPVFFEEIPHDHLAPERIEILKRNVMRIARQMLGIEQDN